MLTKTDVKRRLSIPDHCLNDLRPSFKGSPGGNDLVVKDESSGSIWTFDCTFRDTALPRPFIDKGWREFVQNKELRSGDMVILRKDEDRSTGVQFKIQVKKIVQSSS